MIKTYSVSRDGNTYITPHFQIGEFRSFNDALQKLTSDTILIDENLPVMLEKLYTYCDKKYGGISHMTITSGYRTQDFENYLGGIQNGPHVQGIAADIMTYKKNGSLVPGTEMCCNAQEVGFNGIGYIGNAIHVDVRAWKSYFNEQNGQTGIADWYDYFKIAKPTPVPTPTDDRDKQISDLKSQLENANNIINQLNTKINDLQAQILVKDKTISELQGELNSERNIKYSKFIEKTDIYAISLNENELLIIK